MGACCVSPLIEFETRVCRMPPGTASSMLAGPRLALGSRGQIICTFVAQTASGTNDFKPMLASSADGGRTWSAPRPIWPELFERYSIFGSVSRGHDGRLLFFGSRTVIDVPGEPFWSDATQGLKPNELVWSSSRDDGQTWAPFQIIPQPVPGSAEAPGAICETRAGRLVCCYAPYPTFDPSLQVETNQVISLSSGDEGKSWQAARMLAFESPAAKGAEAWVVELSDGRLLGTGWHVQPGTDQPNAFALSADGGRSWGPTRSTGILGQSTALAAWHDGEAIFVFNQRRFGDIGVWLARVRPTDEGFGIISNERVWAAPRPAVDLAKTSAENWTNFSFGEPAALPLPDGSVLVVLWTAPENGGGEIVAVKVAGLA